MVFISNQLIFVSAMVQRNSTGMDGKGKDKAIPLQAWTCLLGSMRFKFPDF
jgi:hypothetical protein